MAKTIQGATDEFRVYGPLVGAELKAGGDYSRLILNGEVVMEFNLEFAKTVVQTMTMLAMGKDEFLQYQADSEKEDRT